MTWLFNLIFQDTSVIPKQQLTLDERLPMCFKNLLLSKLHHPFAPPPASRL
jgi:hypothetical protein